MILKTTIIMPICVNGNCYDDNDNDKDNDNDYDNLRSAVPR